MSFDGQAIIDAAGTATVTIKNDDPVAGFTVSFFTVQAQDILDGQCRVYRGLSTNENDRLTGSAIARNDQATGPYYMAAGSILTFQFTEMTPGVLVIVSHTGYPVTEVPLSQGKLTFANPLPQDKSAQPVTQTRLEYLNLGDATSVFPFNFATAVDIEPATIDVYYRLVGLYLSVLRPPLSASGYHGFSVIQGSVGGLSFGNLQGLSRYDGSVQFVANTWDIATRTARPDTPMAQQESMKLLRAELGAPIKIVYSNQTNVTQTGARTIVAVVERTAIGT